MSLQLAICCLLLLAGITVLRGFLAFAHYLIFAVLLLSVIFSIKTNKQQQKTQQQQQRLAETALQTLKRPDDKLQEQLINAIMQQQQQQQVSCSRLYAQKASLFCFLRAQTAEGKQERRTSSFVLLHNSTSSGSRRIFRGIYENGCESNKRRAEK